MYAHLQDAAKDPHFRARRASVYLEVQNAPPAAIWLDVYDNNPGSAALHRELGWEPVTTVYRRALS